MTDWFRMWHGAPTDPKWRTIARRAGVRPVDVWGVVSILMDRASQADDRGSVVGFDEEIAADALGCEPEEVAAIMEALTDKGVIAGGRLSSWEKYQPKREDGAAERAKAWRDAQRARGQQNDHQETDANARERTRTQTIAREEERREEENIPSSPPSEVRSPAAVEETSAAVEAYNAEAEVAGWPKVQRLTETRRRSLRQRLTECGGMNGWIEAMARARASPFLTGDNDRGWKADFDFFLQAKSFTKLMEGGYDRREPQHRALGPGSRAGYSPRVGAPDTLISAVADLLHERDGVGAESCFERG